MPSLRGPPGAWWASQARHTLRLIRDRWGSAAWWPLWLGRRGALVWEQGRPADRARLATALLLLDQVLHGALGGVLSVEKLAVQLRRLILHALQSGEAVARQLQGVGEDRVVRREPRKGWRSAAGVSVRSSSGWQFHSLGGENREPDFVWRAGGVSPLFRRANRGLTLPARRSGVSVSA